MKKRFKIVERRIQIVEYVVEAETEELAKKFEGEIESQDVVDGWGESVESCVELAEGEE